jgi:large subunit ribosomal protein L31
VVITWHYALFGSHNYVETRGIQPFSPQIGLVACDSIFLWYDCAPRGSRVRVFWQARHRNRGQSMKAEIHPKYEEITATCSCGNVIKTRSTMCEDIHLEVCSQCHPFYTGKQKILDTAGRIDRFNKRFGNRGSK